MTNIAAFVIGTLWGFFSLMSLGFGAGKGLSGLQQITILIEFLPGTLAGITYYFLKNILNLDISKNSPQNVTLPLAILYGIAICYLAVTVPKLIAKRIEKS